MTTITLPRATVEQALEAMRRAVPTGKITLYEWDRAISDLAAVLAQRAEPVEPITRLFGTLPVHDAQQAEPVEPVAWAFRHSDGTYHDPSVTEHSAGMVPLYPPPPQRKPLMEGVLMGVYIDFDRAADPAWSKAEYLLHFARAVERAVERAHGITDPQIADRLARHGIPMPGDPK